MSSELKGAARASCAARGLRDPYVAFSLNRQNAKERGIDWQLTFDQWWTLWSEFFHMRGRGKNELCLGRIGDAGAYAVGNVYLTTHLGNARDYSDRVQAINRAREEKESKRWGKADSMQRPCAKISTLSV